MKSKNKIIIQQSGWSLEQLTQWPISASYHHQGWCTSTDKDDFDSYSIRGDLWVLFKPNDRRTRPSYQVFISERGSAEVMGSGNRNSSLAALTQITPTRIANWLTDQIELIESKHVDSRMISTTSAYTQDFSRLQTAFANAAPSIASVARSLSGLHQYPPASRSPCIIDLQVQADQARDSLGPALTGIKTGDTIRIQLSHTVSINDVAHQIPMDKVTEYGSASEVDYERLATSGYVGNEIVIGGIQGRDCISRATFLISQREVSWRNAREDDFDIQLDLLRVEHNTYVARVDCIDGSGMFIGLGHDEN